MSNRRKLPKPKRIVCRQCAAGNHTGHLHAVCPVCNGRIDTGSKHVHRVDNFVRTFYGPGAG